MLPSRLFRNTGIPPALRSLITPGTNLPATISVQLRLRLGVRPGSLKAASLRASQNQTATFFTSTKASEEASLKVAPPTPSANSDGANDSSRTEPTTSSQPLPGKVEPKLSLTMTCSVNGCGHRSSHEFTKQAYENGVVLIQCPNCKSRHLIADHLGWFKDLTADGKLPTLEDIMKSKGETIKRGITDPSGTMQFIEDDSK